MGNTITLELIDGQGRATSKDIDLVNTITTLAQAQTALDAIVADWPLLSGLGITGASVSIKMVVTPTTAQSTANKDEGARVKLLMEDGGNFNWRIPSPLKDVSGEFVYITGGAVNVADAGVVGWFANYLSAGAARFTKYGQRVLAVGGILSGELEEK